MLLQIVCSLCLFFFVNQNNKQLATSNKQQAKKTKKNKIQYYIFPKKKRVGKVKTTKQKKGWVHWKTKTNIDKINKKLKAHIFFWETKTNIDKINKTSYLFIFFTFYIQII